MLRRGVPVARPLEAYPGGNAGKKAKRYIRVNDLMCDDVVANLEREIDQGLYTYMHFGICCAGWGKANEMNGGTRTREEPLGGAKGPLLEREVLSNRMAVIVCRLCMKLHQNGAFFSLENPEESHLWLCVYVLELLALCGDEAIVVNFHQCAFDLQLPGCAENMFCKKATTLLTNIHELKGLERRCPGKSDAHQHDCAWGTGKCDGTSYSKAAAAGRYPPKLCGSWSELACAAISARFWRGASPWRGDGC